MPQCGSLTDTNPLASTVIVRQAADNRGLERFFHVAEVAPPLLTLTSRPMY